MIKLKELFFEALATEMPHFELQDGSIIDLNIEKYPINDMQKRKLMMAFHQGDGVLAKTAQGFVVFDQYGMHKASPQQQVKMKDVMLPDYWEQHSVKA
jgi:hypothetical protein